MSNDNNLTLLKAEAQKLGDLFGNAISQWEDDVIERLTPEQICTILHNAVMQNTATAFVLLLDRLVDTSDKEEFIKESLTQIVHLIEIGCNHMGKLKDNPQ